MQNHMENRAYGGFFIRVIAFAIDSVLAFMAAGIIKGPFSLAASLGLDFLKANFIFHYSFVDVVGYLGVVAYFVLLTYYTHSTVGKMLFGLEVVSKDGEWTFLNVIYRETIGRFLSSLGNIGYLAVLVQKEKQGFHDMLCNTYVVYKNMVKKTEPVVVAPAPVNVEAAPVACEMTVSAQQVEEVVEEVSSQEVEPPQYYTTSEFTMNKEEQQ